jgi:predicted aldo/keto reductase-like oxidoreductase
MEMEKIRLGKTNLMVSRSGFGAIPIQRVSDEDSTALLRAAFAGGMNYYDTARGYTTSEHKIGLALGDVRDQIIIATKSGAQTGGQLEENLETSFDQLGTDYIDIYQFHNPSFVPKPGEANGLYDAALKAKASGKIKHIGITSHRLDLAIEMVKSDLFETMQFPMSSLASSEEIALVELCKKHDVGFVAMKGMAGGLITNAKSTFAFIRQFDNVIPIWGVQYMRELEEFLEYEKNPPVLDGGIWEIINQDRAKLTSGFCRACGYCLPCPAEIPIPMAARMELLLGRMDWRGLITEDWQKNMGRINNCANCRHCIDHCPYGLDTPELLKVNLEYFNKFVAEHKN